MFPIVFHLQMMCHSFRCNILNYLGNGLHHQLIDKVVLQVYEHNCQDNLWIRQMLLYYPEKLLEIIKYNLFFIFISHVTQIHRLYNNSLFPKCKSQNWIEEFRFLAQWFMTTIRKLSPFRTKTMDVEQFFINFSFGSVIIHIIIMHISSILDKRFLFHEFSGFFWSSVVHKINKMKIKMLKK